MSELHIIDEVASISWFLQISIKVWDSKAFFPTFVVDLKIIRVVMILYEVYELLDLYGDLNLVTYSELECRQINQLLTCFTYEILELLLELLRMNTDMRHCIPLYKQLIFLRLLSTAFTLTLVICEVVFNHELI
jgi:hypothetical protein